MAGDFERMSGGQNDGRAAVSGNQKGADDCMCVVGQETVALAAIPQHVAGRMSEGRRHYTHSKLRFGRRTIRARLCMRVWPTEIRARRKTPGEPSKGHGDASWSLLK